MKKGKWFKTKLEKKVVDYIIKYKMSCGGEFGDIISLTNCPFDKSCKVGSIICEKCVYFLGKDEKRQIVFCKRKKEVTEKELIKYNV